MSSNSSFSLFVRCVYWFSLDSCFCCWSPIFLCSCLFSIAFIDFSHVWTWSNFSFSSFLAYWFSCVFPFFIAHCFPCFYCWEIWTCSNSGASLALLSYLKTFYWPAHRMLCLISYCISLLFYWYSFFCFLVVFSHLKASFDTSNFSIAIEMAKKAGKAKVPTGSRRCDDCLRKFEEEMREQALRSHSHVQKPRKHWTK